MDVVGGEVRIEVGCDGVQWAGGEGQRLHLHGDEQRQWRHPDTCQLQTIITAEVPRVLDPQTGKTQMVKVPWAEARSGWTLLFEHFAIRVRLGCATISDALKRLGIHWPQGQKIMAAAVERGLERRQLEAIPDVGLDKKSFQRGQDDISVMTDLLGERVLEVVGGRDRPAVLQLWE